MVLYDGNYNFLGMSEKLLQKLGYDDINEFSSYHRDFADLFEKQNELIYNFENFSWIDFVLYGGANKDQVLINTKTGDQIDAKIKIEEIPLKDEFGGVEKLYSVTIVEKSNLQNKSTKNKKPKNKINLSSMLSYDEPEVKVETKEEAETNNKIFMRTDEKDELDNTDDSNLDINLSFIKDEDLKEDTKTTKPSFSLDFLKRDKEKTDETVKPKEEKKNTPTNDEVVLNFFNSTISQEDEKDEEKHEETKLEIKSQETLLNINTSKTDEKKEKESNLKINIFQDKEEKQEKPSVDLNFMKKDTKKDENLQQTLEEDNQKEPTINLNFLKADDKKEEKEAPSINLNFLKQDDSEENKSQKAPIQEKEERGPKINLNFLKADEEKEEPKTKPIQQQEKKEAPSINLNFLKQDTREEEKQQQPSVKNEKSEEPTINLNFLKADEEKEEPKTEPIQQQEKKEAPSINLNFLKQDTKEEEKQQQPPVKNEKSEEPKINLNFLKADEEKEEPKTEPIQQQEKKETLSINLNFLKSETAKNKEAEISQEKTVKSPDTVNIASLTELQQKEDKISKAKKENIIKQIKEDIDEIDSTQDNSISNNEITINEALKSVLNLNNKPKEKETVKIKSITKKQTVKESKPEKTSNSFIFLQHLELTEDEKKSILKDFIEDAKYNLNIINNFFDQDDIDSIKYIAIKIKSSSDILGLDDITSTLSKLTQTNSKDDTHELITEIENQINKLENYI